CFAAGFILVTSEADAAAADALPKTARTVLMYKPFDLQQLAGALAQAAGQAPQQMPTPAAHRPTENLQGLVVDDSAAARAHIRAVLRGLGFRSITEVADGAAAVEQLRQGKFDLVVTDYNMPGLNGRELVRFIRQDSATPAVPVLMVTTETDPA